MRGGGADIRIRSLVREGKYRLPSTTLSVSTAGRRASSEAPAFCQPPCARSSIWTASTSIGALSRAHREKPAGWPRTPTPTSPSTPPQRTHFPLTQPQFCNTFDTCLAKPIQKQSETSIHSPPSRTSVTSFSHATPPYRPYPDPTSHRALLCLNSQAAKKSPAVPDSTPKRGRPLAPNHSHHHRYQVILLQAGSDRLFQSYVAPLSPKYPYKRRRCNSPCRPSKAPLRIPRQTRSRHRPFRSYAGQIQHAMLSFNPHRWNRH